MTHRYNSCKRLRPSRFYTSICFAHRIPPFQNFVFSDSRERDYWRLASPSRGAFSFSFRRSEAVGIAPSTGSEISGRRGNPVHSSPCPVLWTRGAMTASGPVPTDDRRLTRDGRRQTTFQGRDADRGRLTLSHPRPGARQQAPAHSTMSD